MDKQALINQMIAQVRESIGVATREGAAAADAARDGDDANAKREDARMALEYGALAAGQSRRVEQAHFMLSQLETFRPRTVPRGGRVEVGALIEIEDVDSGNGRTLFIAPVGAGMELTGPGGDGFLSVVTPTSPIGRAAQGRQLGESIDVTVDGETRSWEITWLE